MEPVGGVARVRAADSRFSALAEGGWSRKAQCGGAVELLISVGHSSNGRAVPRDFEAVMERAENAAGCPKREGGGGGADVLPFFSDPQFPPLGPTEELQAAVWLQNRYGFGPNEYVFEDQLPSYKEQPGAETEFAPLTVADLMRLRPRSLLREAEAESAIWVNDEVINFYLGLLRKLARERYGAAAKLFIFSTFLYSRIEAELSQPRLRHSDTKDIRARMFEVGALLIFPIHHGGNHWIVCTVAIAAPGVGEFKCYDSLCTAFVPEYRENLKRWLSEEYELLLAGSSFSLGVKDVERGDELAFSQDLRQENFYDCGVFTMFVARGLVLRRVYHGRAKLVPAIPNFAPRTVSLRSDYMRRALALEIVNHRIPRSDWK